MFEIKNFLFGKPAHSMSRSEKNVQTMVEKAPIGICVTNEEGQFVYVNPTYCELHGYTPDELLGNHFSMILDQSNSDELQQLYNESKSREDEFQGEWTVKTKAGKILTVLANSAWTSGHDKRLRKVTFVIDITKRRILEDELRATRDQLDKLLQNQTIELDKAKTQLEGMRIAVEESINIIYITDEKGIIEYVNPVFETVSGYRQDEIVGQTSKIFSSGVTSQETYKIMWDTLNVGKTWRGTFKNRKKSGEFYWVKGLISPIRNEKGKIIKFMAIQEDVTEKYKIKKDKKYLLNHDFVTSMFNRHHFIEQLERKIVEEKKGILILIDIDKFSIINSNFGNNLSDEYFKQVSIRVKSVIRDHHQDFIIGRFGEDQIIAFLEGLNEQEGFDLAEYVRAEVELLRFTRDRIHSTVCVGVVSFPNHGKTMDELLRHLATCISIAKKQGRNQSYLFQEQDLNYELSHQQYKEKDKILEVLEEDRFEIWFQPIFELRNQKVSHFEVLARMREKDGRIILPGGFIPAAESFGLIGLIDRVVIKKTLEFQKQYRHNGKEISLAINLSGKDLGDKKLLSFLESEFAKSGANPARITFEITETSAIADLERAITFVKALKAIGCQFSLDDFGVGFTSFLYLRDLPVDFLKIDGAFIKRLHERQEDQGIVKAITSIAKGFNIKTVAEFVEKGETITLLKAFGIDYAQGFLLGRPNPEPVFTETTLVKESEFHRT